MTISSFKIMELFGVNSYFYSYLKDQGGNLLVGSIDLVTAALRKYDHFTKSYRLTSVMKPFYRSK